MPVHNLFVGRHLRLAAPLEADAEPCAAWSRDPNYLRNLDTDIARPMSPKDYAEQFLQPAPDGRSFSFSLRTIPEDQLIGFVAIHSIEWNNQYGRIAIGIGDSNFRGRGLGREALELLLNYAFNELNLHRIGLDVIADNIRAVRTYESVGFRHEGALRQAVYRDGKRYDLLVMGILRDEWLALQQERSEES